MERNNNYSSKFFIYESYKISIRLVQVYILKQIKLNNEVKVWRL
nr:MAG TPA: hypothetical protein [Caudoviricetes sp.]